MKINKLHTFNTVQIPKLHGLLTRSYTLRQLIPKDSPGTLSTISIGCILEAIISSKLLQFRWYFDTKHADGQSPFYQK